MSQTKHYTGLTDAQVEDSRNRNGANVLTPPGSSRCSLVSLRNSKTL